MVGLQLQHKTSADATENGRDTPDLCPISFRYEKGVLVPVIWCMGPVDCGHCGFKSRSYQGLQKHLHAVHQDDMAEYEQKINRQRAYMTLLVPDGKCPEANSTFTPKLSPEVKSYIEDFQKQTQEDLLPTLENTPRKRQSKARYPRKTNTRTR